MSQDPQICDPIFKGGCNSYGYQLSLSEKFHPRMLNIQFYKCKSKVHKSLVFGEF